jgi:hypothetical protein
VSWEGVEHDRMAQTAEQITLEELQLAARNHGMPLEALRYPVTPVGLHYLLMHYDMPFVEVGSWRLSVGGRVERRLELALEELRARPARELAVTMECAGNGRARLSPRPFSQPWLDEAVGTARWRGLPLAPLLREAGILDDAVEVVFAGLDRGVEAGVEQAYERSLPLAEAPGLRGQWSAAPSAARLPATSRGPRLVRDDEREVADRDHGLRPPVRGAPAEGGLPYARS